MIGRTLRLSHKRFVIHSFLVLLSIVLAWSLFIDLGNHKVAAQPPQPQEEIFIDFDRPNSGMNWHNPETTPDGKTFQWMSDRTATLDLFLEPRSGANIEFCVAQGVPNAVETLKLQANGQDVALFRASTASCPLWFSGHIMHETLASSSGQTTLTFLTDAADTADSLVHNGDMRMLSAALDWLRVTSDREVFIDFDHPNSGINWQNPDISPEGMTYQWMSDRVATLDLFLESSSGANVEFCVLRAIPNAVETLKFQANGQDVTLLRSTTTSCPFLFSGHIAQEALASSPGQLMITFLTDAADTADNIVHNGDMRMLSAALDWLRVTSDREVFIDFDHLNPGTNWHSTDISPEGRTYQWMSDRTATLGVFFQSNGGANIEFCVLRAIPNAAETLKLQANGQEVALLKANTTSCPFLFSGHVPQEAVASSPDQLMLTFMTDAADTADSVVHNGDMRVLSAALDWLRVTTDREVFIDFDHANPGTNWHNPEVTSEGVTFEWTSDHIATLDIPFQATNGAWLEFCVWQSMLNAADTLRVQVNGQEIPLSRTSNAACPFWFSAKVPQEALALNPTQVTLTFLTDIIDSGDNAVGNGDTRLLGVALDWLRLEE